jgi:hypothetical protein
MTNNLQRGLNKLKGATEKIPKYTVNQTQVLSHNIFVFDLSDVIDSRGIIELCKNYQTEKFREKKTASVYAWRSEYTIVQNNPMVGFENLFSTVENKLNSSLIESHTYPYSYFVHHYWFAIYSKGDSSNIHNHNAVDLACVYYANVPKNSAPLVITDDTENISIDPKEGMLVVMPGRCNHMVPKSEHEEGERIIVAMNVMKHKFIETPY